MTYISETLREQVRQRASGRCEYCQTQERIVAYLEIDHIVPVGAGGLTKPDNLCFACTPCNRSKGDNRTAADPETDREVPLFNPRTQHWTDHFAWNKDFTHIIGMTPIGRATVERLKMNSVRRVIARRLWVEAGLHPPK